MVLPAPATDAGAAEAQAWLGKLIRALELAQRGILFALTDATPTQLGPVVRALSKVPPWASDDEGVLEVCMRGPELVRLKPGSRVLLRVCEADLEWLNVFRPVFADLELRAVLWAGSPEYDALVRRAVDLASWISRDVPVPEKILPDFAVRNVRAALNASVAFCWRGPGLSEALVATDSKLELLELRADIPYRDLLVGLRAKGLPVIDGIHSERDAWRVRMALVQARREGTWVARDPGARLPGMWRLHAEQADWEQASVRLREAGWRRPELMAAWVDLEPEAIEAAVEQVGQPSAEVDVEAVARAEAPPWIMREFVGDGAVRATRLGIQRGTKPEDEAGVVCWAEGSDEGREWNSAADLVRMLRSLDDGIPDSRQVAAAESADFVDVATELARTRWETGQDRRADDLVKWLRQRGETKTAIAIAEEWLARAHADDDDESWETANTWLKTLGNPIDILGRHEDDDEHLERLLVSLMQEHAYERSLVDVQRARGRAFIELGDQHASRGHHESAERCYKDALDISEGLATREPHRIDLQYELSGNLIKLGDAHLALGQSGPALQYYDSALAIRERLVAEHPGQTDLLRELHANYVKLGDLQRALGNAELAQRYYRRADGND